MNYKAIILDLDGTLVDSKLDLALSVNASMKQLGLKELEVSEVFTYVGDGLAMLMQRSLKSVLGEDPSRLLDPAISMFKNYYAKHLLDNTVPYPGVSEVLKDFSSLKLGVITNKNHQFSEKILEGLNLLNHFEFIIGGDNVLNKKPHSEPFLKALKMLNLNETDVLMVGDNHTDINGANDLKIKSCFAEYGFGKLMDIKPDFSISEFKELKTIVLG